MENRLVKRDFVAVYFLDFGFELFSVTVVEVELLCFQDLTSLSIITLRIHLALL